MFTKWIVCTVPAENRSAFSDAQARWQSIANISGFMGQTGGWEVRDPGSACILGLWASRVAYDYFMRAAHDSVLDASGQRATYDHIAVAEFEAVMAMQGRHQGLYEALAEGNFLRTADCQVREGCTAHFEEAQLRLWAPAMAATAGMLGGQFHVSLEQPRRYLTTTLWDSEASHSNYSRDVLPVLRESARVTEDLEKIVGRFIRVETSWRVLPAVPREITK